MSADNDKIIILDTEATSATVLRETIEEYKETYRQVKELEKKLKSLKETLVKVGEGKAYSAFGVAVTEVTKKGTISYRKAYEALPANVQRRVDLADFTGKETSYWTVKATM